jgi:hypothetical protein
MAIPFVYTPSAMPFNKTSDSEWRERQKQKRRELNARRRAQLADDPRVLAMKQALKERRRAAYEKAKKRRKALADEQKRRQRERKAEERAKRDAALMQMLRPATTDDEG